ncbi:three-Cys-motif partner protein [Methanofollis sp. W23]|uniref:three-Cys-motif partner protein TcmP n=1 Tax=Methanofollis sp. W23 TaxID=2817849 RepID=UPI001AE76F2C|nr:three-Cys-motif partner protein TcmP [Methanofollis sp. W23]MBP2144775.1 three-Cys-motif partner protein [Methanofollis sp. W23]
MEFYQDDEGILYNPVKWHTWKKHAFIESYLNIWKEKVKHNPPSLDIFDLYAGTGMCYCEDAEKHNIPESTWDGSSVLSAKCLEDYKNGRYLFLNTYNQIEEYCEKQKNNLRELSKKIRGENDSKTIITSCLIEEAVEEAIEFGDRCNIFRYPTLWILDPCAAKDLPWGVVERIAKLQRPYPHKTKGQQIKKPELIINLMTSDLQRNVDINPHIVSAAFGMKEYEWRPEFDELIKQGKNYRQAIVEIYAQRLSQYYQKPPIIVEINTKNESAIVFCLFLCLDNDAAYYLSRLDGMKEYNARLFQWKQDARRMVAEERLPPGQTKLF